jgi:phosphatidate phosphatase
METPALLLVSILCFIEYNHTYITDYICLNASENDPDANLSRVSFPSGHSSFSAYTMFYCAIYVQVKWGVGRGRSFLRLGKHAVQLILVLLAYFTAISRVMDNKHHWSDVCAGALIGVVSASLTV